MSATPTPHDILLMNVGRTAAALQLKPGDTLLTEAHEKARLKASEAGVSDKQIGEASAEGISSAIKVKSMVR